MFTPVKKMISATIKLYSFQKRGTKYIVLMFGNSFIDKQKPLQSSLLQDQCLIFLAYT
jgi:hypothetical protein